MKKQREGRKRAKNKLRDQGTGGSKEQGGREKSGSLPVKNQRGRSQPLKKIIDQGPGNPIYPPTHTHTLTPTLVSISAATPRGTPFSDIEFSVFSLW